MIEAMRNYTNHTVIGIIVEGIPALKNSLNALVQRIALDILAQVVITVPLFYLQPNLFALGFIIGFIFDKKIREIVDKVNIVFIANRSLLEQVLLFGGGGLLAILTMPSSLIVATLYYSAQWGTLLYQNSLARIRQANPQPQPDPHAPVITV
jgi:hypothetical protein